nr:hypothetical protein GCM10025699_12240 [Microbacterium flavescens]
MYTLGRVVNEEVRSMRASDRAYATLLDEIQDGALPPGTVLGEVEQAARLGVSRTPLREALGRLAADGLVVQQSPRVTVVTAIDAGDIREIFEVRRALEESAARLAAERGMPRPSPIWRSSSRAPTSPARPVSTRTTHSSGGSIDASTNRSRTTTSPRPCAPSAPTSCGCGVSPATTPTVSRPPPPSTA